MSFIRRVFLLLLIVLALGACRSAATPTPESVGLAPGAGTQQLLVLPDDGVRPVLDLIDGAEQSIRFKIYLLTYRDVRAALVRAANRGVDVRVIIEQQPVGGGESNLESYDDLRANGVQVRWAPADLYRLTHEKSLVIDDRTALFGTFNYTVSSFKSNREYGLLTDDAALVAEIAKVFDADWAGEPVQPAANSPLVFSPANSRRSILDLIDSARNSLWLEQSTLLDDEVTDRLVAAARRGVDVRFIGPLRFDEQDFSEPNYQRLREAGAEVVLQADPIIHAKVILADGNRALLGSINLTYSSMDLNRELGIVSEDAAVIARLRQTIETDWARAASIPSAPEGVILWQDAENYAGAEVTVEGEIVRTYNSGKVTFLNFADDYRGTLTLVIFASAYELFPQPPAEYFLHRTLRATGIVKMYEGAPEIIVESPAQIEILGGGAEAEPAPVVEDEQPPLEPGEIVSWQDVANYVGREITVEGQVVRTFDTGNVTFLNFTQDWRGTFSVAIFAADYGKFPAPPVELFLDQPVKITGTVKEYQGAPEIIVESPAQIEILAAPAIPLTPTAPDPDPPSGIVPWQEAAQHLGQTITVSGRIIRSNDTGTITFLNFSNERDQFVVVVFADDYSAFAQPPAQLFDGKEVWITGEIDEYNGTPQIILRDPAQIEVFD